MEYWIISLEEFYDEKKLAMANLPLERPNFGDGKEIKGDVPMLLATIERKSKGIICDVVDGHLNILIHKKVKEKLEEESISNVQYFPVDIEDERGAIHKDYFVLNIKSRTDVTDKNNSEIVWKRNNKFSNVYKWVIDDEKVKEAGVQIFRPKAKFVKVVVDNRVKEIFEMFDVRSMKFINTKDWRYFDFEEDYHLIYKPE